MVLVERAFILCFILQVYWLSRVLERSRLEDYGNIWNRGFFHHD